MGDSPQLVAKSNSNSVNPNYCEIIVIRHGETAWNVDGKIQVCIYLFILHFW